MSVDGSPASAPRRLSSLSQSLPAPSQSRPSAFASSSSPSGSPLAHTPPAPLRDGLAGRLRTGNAAVLLAELDELDRASKGRAVLASSFSSSAHGHAGHEVGEAPGGLIQTKWLRTGSDASLRKPRAASASPLPARSQSAAAAAAASSSAGGGASGGASSSTAGASEGAHQASTVRLLRALDKEKAERVLVEAECERLRTRVLDAERRAGALEASLKDLKRVRTLEETVHAHRALADGAQKEAREVKARSHEAKAETALLAAALASATEEARVAEAEATALRIRVKEAEEVARVAHEKMALQAGDLDREKARWRSEMHALRMQLVEARRPKDATATKRRLAAAALTPQEVQEREALFQRWRALASAGNPAASSVNLKTLMFFPERICEITGAADLDAAMEVFAHKPDFNHKLLGYVTELVLAQEKLSEEMDLLRVAVAEAESPADQSVRKKLEKQVEDRVRASEAEVARLSTVAAAATASLARLRSGVETACAALSLPDPVTPPAADAEAVIAARIGTLEVRVRELQHLAAQPHHHTSSSGLRGLSVSTPVPSKSRLAPTISLLSHQKNKPSPLPQPRFGALASITSSSSMSILSIPLPSSTTPGDPPPRQQQPQSQSPPPAGVEQQEGEQDSPVTILSVDDYKVEAMKRIKQLERIANRAKDRAEKKV
jgi:hypothetical protein